MLQLSRLGQVAMRCERLDMNRLLQQVVATLTIQAEAAGAQIEIGSLPECVADASMVNQIFTNLLDNALKYRHPTRAPRIEVSGRVEEEQAVYCVADNGLGIAPEEVASIWELFRRLNPSGPVGEGVGLSLVRRIVERHRGRIWVESTPGLGAQFLVALPRAP
jgi:signal transduction histidine kinase